MSKTYDELMKILEEKGEIPDDVAKNIIKEHGALSDEEKKNVASAIKMNKALTKKDDKKDDKKEDKKEEKKDGGKDEKKESDEVSMDDYLQALSVLDSEGSSKEDKAKAQKIKDKFEG